ncbi:MAG: hypothetical protein GXO42_01810 [bacterium]|nr:hypothetical protein [bacterium]
MRANMVPYYYPVSQELAVLCKPENSKLLENFEEGLPFYLFVHDYAIFLQEKSLDKALKREQKLYKKLLKKANYSLQALKTVTCQYFAACLRYFENRIEKDKEFKEILEEDSELYYYYYHIFSCFRKLELLLQYKPDKFFIPANEQELTLTRLFYFSPFLPFASWYSDELLVQFRQLVLYFENLAGGLIETA